MGFYPLFEFVLGLHTVFLFLTLSQIEDVPMRLQLWDTAGKSMLI